MKTIIIMLISISLLLLIGCGSDGVLGTSQTMCGCANPDDYSSSSNDDSSSSQD